MFSVLIHYKRRVILWTVVDADSAEVAGGLSFLLFYSAAAVMASVEIAAIMAVADAANLRK